MNDEYRDIIIEEKGETMYRCTRCNVIIGGDADAEKHMVRHAHFDGIKDHLLVIEHAEEDYDKEDVYIIHKEDASGVKGFRFQYFKGRYSISVLNPYYILDIMDFAPASDAQRHLFCERMTRQFGVFVKTITGGSE